MNVVHNWYAEQGFASIHFMNGVQFLIDTRPIMLL